MNIASPAPHRPSLSSLPPIAHHHLDAPLPTHSQCTGPRRRDIADRFQLSTPGGTSHALSPDPVNDPNRFTRQSTRFLPRQSTFHGGKMASPIYSPSKPLSGPAHTHLPPLAPTRREGIASSLISAANKENVNLASSAPHFQYDRAIVSRAWGDVPSVTDCQPATAKRPLGNCRPALGQKTKLPNPASSGRAPHHREAPLPPSPIPRRVLEPITSSRSNMASRSDENQTLGQSYRQGDSPVSLSHSFPYPRLSHRLVYDTPTPSDRGRNHSPVPIRASGRGYLSPPPTPTLLSCLPNQLIMPRAKKAKKSPTTVATRLHPRGEAHPPLLGFPDAPQAGPSTVPLTPNSSGSGISATGISPPVPFDIADLPPAKVFPGRLPEGYCNKTIVPVEHLISRGNGNSGSGSAKGWTRSNSHSLNPWDYKLNDSDTVAAKTKDRKRFTPSELTTLEGLWHANQNPMMSQKERLGAWLGVPTRHLTIWFQNRRQERKKYREELRAEADKLAQPAAAAELIADAVATADGADLTCTETIAAAIEAVDHSATLPAAVDADTMGETTAALANTSEQTIIKEALTGTSSVKTPAKKVNHRGTFDPSTGKHRPVPMACIASLEPPPLSRAAALRAICNGDYTREMYFADHSRPQDRPGAVPSATTSDASVQRTANSSLQHILQERESNFGEVRRRHHTGESEYHFTHDAKERNQQLLGLLSSDPPSEAAYEDEHESDGTADSTDAPTEKLKPTIGMGLPKGSYWKANSENRQLNRATSLDVFAASSRAKELAGSGLSRSISGHVALSSSEPSLGKRAPPEVPKHAESAAKRARLVGNNYVPGEVLRRSNATQGPSYRHHDSFSRSTSATGVGQSEIPAARTPQDARATSCSSTWGSSPPLVSASPVTAFSVNRWKEMGPGNTIYRRPTELGTRAVPDCRTEGQTETKADVNADDKEIETDADTVEAAKCLLSIIGASQSSMSSGSE